MKCGFARAIVMGLLAGIAVESIEVVQAQTADYPTKPITVIVASPPGGSVDIMTRFYGQKFQEKTGQPFIVLNKVGAFNSQAAEALTNAAPDGYTMMVGTSASHAANVHLFKNLPYDPVADFTPVARLFRLALALVVNTDKTPVSTVGELTEFLKKKARPTYGYFGSTSRASSAQYASLAGLKAAPIAYKGTSQMITDLRAGQFDFGFSDAAIALNPPAPSIKSLAVTLEERSTLVPNLPTMSEAGVKGYQPIYTWFGMYMPAKTPEARVARMAAILKEIVEDPASLKQLASFAGEPFVSTPAELAKFQKEWTDLWKHLVDLAGIAPE